MKTIKDIRKTQEDKDPCWPGYKQVGTKMKNGKEVPNCVPIDEALELEEGPLVMDDPKLLDGIFEKLEDKWAKLKRRNEKDAFAFMQTLAKMAGYGLSKSKQTKGKSFRYDLKK